MPRLTIFKKILITTLLLSLVPLVISSLFLFFSLESINSRLPVEIGETADRQASQSLQMRAQHVADTITDFLQRCENDALFLAASQLDQQSLMNFYITRRGELWELGEHADSSRETHTTVPLYSSIALLDAKGNEQVVIRDGRYLPAQELRNRGNPAGTEFKNEEYVRRIRELNRGEVYVSHLTGFHVSKKEQLGDADEPEHARRGALYRGVIRFGTPIHNRQGSLTGMIVLSLDHRHLMEFSQHIDPGRNFSTVFPSYKSGNYAFLFDDQGWIITHPKYWDIRGIDQNGTPFPPYRQESSSADVASGRIPFNLDYAAFVHPNYPQVAASVREKKAGYVDITNVGGSKKVMAFAPILYSTGDYGKYGVFGGVTIGFQVDQFHDAAREGSNLIRKQLGDHRRQSAVIVLLTALAAGCSAWWLSHGISTPLRKLTEGAHQLAQGETGSRVQITSRDELGDLAASFNFMAEELQQRKTNLLSTLDELRRSRLEIMDERNFKESILESISSAIVTFSPDGLLTSINTTGRAFLGSQTAVGMHYTELFREWEGMAALISLALHQQQGYGRQPFIREQDANATHFDVGFFPIASNGAKGLTVTLRNETEREKLREEMIRLDRLASLGKLSAGIAHEVRNPLTGISLLLDDLHDRNTSSPDDREMITKALAEIERVEKLINALLNYSSPTRIDFRPAELGMVVHDTVLLMRRQAQRQGVDIRTVGETPPPFRFDPEKIKQALLNIVKNALEAMTAGGTITIAMRSSAETALLVVCDNGPGISEADLPQIFEPFFTRKGAGTGLGLSITQRIMTEHGGGVQVTSSPESGTCFTLTIPLHHQEQGS